MSTIFFSSVGGVIHGTGAHHIIISENADQYALVINGIIGSIVCGMLMSGLMSNNPRMLLPALVLIPISCITPMAVLINRTGG